MQQETYWKAASRILGERITRFVRLCRKTASRATEENIHDLRVSARRLAAAQAVFDLEELADLKRAASRIRRSIGKIRDLDVAIGNIRQFAEGVEDSGEIAGCVRQLSSNRRRILRKLRPSLRLMVLKVPLVVPQGEERPFMTEARVYLPPLVDGAQGLELGLRSPENSGPVHRLRIRIKRLRYRIELFGSGLDDRSERWLESCKRVQDRLGDLHDRDVLIGILEKRWEQQIGQGHDGRALSRLLEDVWRDRHRRNAEMLRTLSLGFLEEIRQRALEFQV
ncbi:MAG: CHAD domain-containing protein [Acidobacteria bacterium]|nr:CHAD domain-containing protein [Acidobacteriota bacterium]